MYIYHITSKQEWLQASASDTYLPIGYAQDGFIHCSKQEQVLKTANRFYAGQTGLVLLKIDATLLNGAVKEENLEGGQELFPHIYAPLPVKAVTQAPDFVSGPDGFLWPAGL
jgi:Uncharacterized protein conserved in bacteria